MAGNAVEIGRARVIVLPEVKKGSGSQIGADILGQVDGQEIGQEIGADMADGVGESGGDAGDSFSGKFIAAIGAAGIGAAVIGGLKSALEQEDASALLANQVGLAAADVTKYQDAINDVFEGNYGESAEQVSAAFKDILGNVKGARQMTAEEIGGMSKDMLNMSATFGYESNEIAGAIGSMMNTGIVKTWDEGMDVLFTGLQKGGKPAESLLDIFGQYSNNFQALGLDAKQATEIMLGFTNAGVSDVDFAADSMREMGLIMRAGAEETGLVLQGMGLNSADIFAGFQAGGDEAVASYKAVIGALGNVSDSEKANVMTALFGGQSEDFYGAFDAVFSKSGQMVMELGDISQAAENVDANFATTNASISSFTRTALGNFNDFVRTELLPTIIGFSDWFGNNILPVIGPVAEAVGSFVSKLWEFNDIIVPVAIAVGTYAGVVKVVALAQAAWAGGMAALTAAQVALNVAMSANPIGLIVIALIAVGAAVFYAWNHVEGFKEFFVGIWDTIGVAAGGFVNWLTEGAWSAITGFFTGIGTWMGDVAGGIGSFIGTMAQTSVEITNQSLAGMSSMAAGVAGFFSSIFGSIGSGFNNAVAFLGEGIGSIMGFLGDMATGIGQVFRNVAGFISSLFEGVLNTIKSSINILIGAVNAPLSAINNINIKVPKWVPKMGGKSWSPEVPMIPSFATGGTIAPTPGGSIIRVSEMGRAETIVDTGLHNRTMAELERLRNADKNSSGITYHNEMKVEGANKSPAQIARELHRLQRFNNT